MMGVPTREQLREKDWFYQFFSLFDGFQISIKHIK